MIKFNFTRCSFSPVRISSMLIAWMKSVQKRKPRAFFFVGGEVRPKVSRIFPVGAPARRLWEGGWAWSGHRVRVRSKGVSAPQGPVSDRSTSRGRMLRSAWGAWACETTAGAEPYAAVAFPDRLALVLGNEVIGALCFGGVFFFRGGWAWFTSLFLLAHPPHFSLFPLE